MVDAPAERPRILLVEDNEAVRDALAGFLGERYEVHPVGTGQAAVETLRGLDVDLVVSDVAMPGGMDGIQLTRALRRRHPDLPIVIITGLGREEVAVDALRAGATNYLRKPFRDAELDLVVRQCLEGGKRRAQRDQGLRWLELATRSFVVPPDPSVIPHLLPHLTAGAAELGLVEPGDLLHVEIAIQEAIANAIVHGALELTGKVPPDRAQLEQACRARREQPPYGRRTVRVDVELTPQELRVTVEDPGPGFDPARRPPSPTPGGGRGLFLMQSFMDEVLFEHGGRRVVLVRRRGSGRGAR